MKCTFVSKTERGKRSLPLTFFKAEWKRNPRHSMWFTWQRLKQECPSKRHAPSSTYPRLRMHQNGIDFKAIGTVKVPGGKLDGRTGGSRKRNVMLFCGTD